MPASRRWSWSILISPTFACRPHHLGRPAGTPDPVAGGRGAAQRPRCLLPAGGERRSQVAPHRAALKPEAGRFIIGSPVVALPLAEQQTMLLPRDALVLNTEGSVVYQVEQRARS